MLSVLVFSEVMVLHADLCCSVLAVLGKEALGITQLCAGSAAVA